jgi:hypothetical protein
LRWWRCCRSGRSVGSPALCFLLSFALLPYLLQIGSSFFLPLFPGCGELLFRLFLLGLCGCSSLLLFSLYPLFLSDAFCRD